MGRLPDFLVIGAARAGTTALHSYLRQHPGVFMPGVKEPNFFAYEGMDLKVRGPGADFINNSVTRLQDYQALFTQAPTGAICGEASPLYLFEPRAPERIRRHVPDVRMIAVLRNPIDQAFSHFLYATKLSIETERDFTRALDLETERLAAGWQPLFGYSRFPLYAAQLERYFALFPRDQFLIRTYEDYQTAPQTALADMFDFIGAGRDFQPDMSRKLNAGGVPKNQAFQDFLMKSNPITKAVGLVVPRDLRLRIRDRLAQANMRQDETLSHQARTILKARLSDDIHRLEDMIDRDLSGWLA